MSDASQVPERISASMLERDLYSVLDQVLETGVPVEVQRGGGVLKIEAIERTDRLARLRPHTGAICGDPELLVHMDCASTQHP